jgi:hypothetical protein
MKISPEAPAHETSQFEEAIILTDKGTSAIALQKPTVAN